MLPARSFKIPALWSGLKPGPHEVGFQLTLVQDTARGSADPFDGNPLARRSLFRAVWYPAQGNGESAQETLRMYQKVAAPANERERSLLIRSFEQYLSGTLASSMLGVWMLDGDQARLLLDHAQSRELEHQLDQPVFAQRNPPVLANTRFPLVIYHPGAESHYADNFLLCEYLASHGFVVVSASFHDPNSFNPRIGTFEYSYGDLQFIVANVEKDFSVDSHRIGLLGHSFGAQVVLAYSTRDSGIRAVVSLDTTFEGSAPFSSRDSHYQAQYDLAANVEAPILFFTQSEGNDLSFAKLFASSDRHFVRALNATHDDFTTFGTLFQKRDSEKNGQNQISRSEFYINMSQNVHRFFEVHLATPNVSRSAPSPKFDLLDGKTPIWEHTQLAADTKEPSSLREWAEMIQHQGPEVLFTEYCSVPLNCASRAATLIDSLCNLGYSTIAASLIDISIKHSPNSWTLHQSAGLCELRVENFQGALSHFNAAIELLKDDKRWPDTYRDAFRQTLELGIAAAKRRI